MQTELKKDIRLPFFLVSVFEKCDRAAGCHGTVTWLPSAHLSISLPRLVSVHRSFSLSWKVSLLLLPLFCTNYWINEKAYYAIARKVKNFLQGGFLSKAIPWTAAYSTFFNMQFLMSWSLWCNFTLCRILHHSKLDLFFILNFTTANFYNMKCGAQQESGFYYHLCAQLMQRNILYKVCTCERKHFSSKD